MHLSMWVYPWDLFDEGIEVALKRIRDEVGINSVSVALSYDAGKMLSPRNPKRKVFFAEEGVVYFQPMPVWYASLELQPTVSSLCKERNLLSDITEVANKLGMNVIGWLPCYHNLRLAAQRRDCAAVNCFGDVYITHLCPSNSSVRELLLAMIGDLVTNYPLYAIELEAFEYMPFQHSYHHEKVEIELPPLIEFLLGLCFCRSCEQRAKDSGVDFDSVRNTVRSEIERFFMSPSSCPTDPITWDMVTTRFGEEMDGYLQMRITTMSSLLEIIHGRLQNRGQTKLFLFGDPHPVNLWQVGLEPSLLSQYADGVIILAYRLSPPELRTSLTVNRAMLMGKELIVGLNPSEKYVGSFEKFVERIRICIKGGAKGFSFFNYGVLLHHHLRWIRMAITEVARLKK